jgi:homoserine acetyltransferase
MPSGPSASLARRACAQGVHKVIDSTYGHDAFLMEEAKITPTISCALEETCCLVSSEG